MTNVYESCPVFESDEYLLRLSSLEIGFNKTDRLLIGTMDGYAYKDYWFINK